jgi:hypothetical protein
LKGQNVYLPTDLRDYFKDRAPQLFKKYESTFPSEFGSIVDVDKLFGDESWSILGKSHAEFNIQLSGCHNPTQRYYITWFYMDLYYYYQTKGESCAQGGNFKVCAATLDDRADRVEADWKDSSLCNGAIEFRNKGVEYVKTLRTHPFRSGDGTACIPGSFVEADLKKCGYYNQYAACMFQDQCSNFDSALSAQCPQILSDREKWLKAPTVTSTTDTTSGPSYILITLGIVLGIALLVGFVGLVKTRRKSDGMVKTLGRTMGRTLGRARSNPGAQAQPTVVSDPAGPGANPMAAPVETNRGSVMLVNSPHPVGGVPSMMLASPALGAVGGDTSEVLVVDGNVSPYVYTVDANGMPVQTVQYIDDQGYLQTAQASPMPAPYVYDPNTASVFMANGNEARYSYYDPATGVIAVQEPSEATIQDDQGRR